MSEVLATSWQLWVVENLLAGHPPAAVAEALIGQGLPEGLARGHVDEVVASESFQRLRAARHRGWHAERVATLLHELPGPVAVDVLDDVGPEVLLERYWSRCRPVLLRRTARRMRAVREWTLDGLATRFPDATVQVSADRQREGPRSAKEACQRRIPLAELVARAAGPRSDAVYLVARSGLLHDPQFAALIDDLAPLPPFLDPALTARHTGVWIGPEGTHTVTHFDPHSALLVQVQGRKRVRLAAPTVGALAAASDGWFSTLDLDDPALEDHVHTVELGPGEALLVPAGWWHEVHALAPSITLSFLGFVWDNDVHWLGPPSRPQR